MKVRILKWSGLFWFKNKIVTLLVDGRHNTVTENKYPRFYEHIK